LIGPKILLDKKESRTKKEKKKKKKKKNPKEKDMSIRERNGLQRAAD